VFYRIIYIIWRVFWSSFWVMLITMMLFSGLVFLMLQTKPVRDYLVERAELWYNEQFEGTLKIGELGGVLPVTAEIRDVSITYKDHTPISFESLHVRLDLLSLLRNQLTIIDLHLDQPNLMLYKGDSGRLALAEAFDRSSPAAATGPDLLYFMESFDLYAPLVRISNGYIHINEGLETPDLPQLPLPFTAGQLDASVFLELSQDLRYLDISSFSMVIASMDSIPVTLSGQIYNDSHFLELNAMRLGVGNSHFDWDSEFTGINLAMDNLAGQFREAGWEADIRRAHVSESNLKTWFNELPEGFPDLNFSLSAAGKGPMFSISDADMEAGNNRLIFEAQLENLLNRELLTYDFRIYQLITDGSLPEFFIPAWEQLPIMSWKDADLKGAFRGTADSLVLSADFGLPGGGRISVAGGVDLMHPFAIDLDVFGYDLDISIFENVPTYQSRINTELNIIGNQLADPDYELHIFADIIDSYIGALSVPDMHFDAEYSRGVLRHDFAYHQHDRFLNGRGQVDFTGATPNFIITGESSGLNLAEAIPDKGFPETAWNMQFDINWHGMKPDDWFGRMIVDVYPSLINGNELSPHQMYLDLNDPKSENRSLRLTSTILDVLVEGDIRISAITGLYDHWQGFFTHRITDELLLQETDTISIREGPADEQVNAEFWVELKNLGLIRSYVPDFPELRSGGQLQLNVTADRDRLAVEADWNDRNTEWNGISVNDSYIGLVTEFRYGQLFRNFAELDLDIRAQRIRFQDQALDDLSWSVHVRDDSLYSRNMVTSLNNNVRFASELEGLLADSLVQAGITRLMIGNDQYMWNSEGHPRIIYDHLGRLHVEDFKLVSGFDEIFIDGIFSTFEDDSVQYRFHNVDLGRISDMVRGRLHFNGILNAGFVTKNLIRSPVFHGNLEVDQLHFDERPVGDLRLNSRYNADYDRFDTEFHIWTDDDKYESYLRENNAYGQNIQAAGWLKAPAHGQSPDSLYYFDVDVRTVDLWVLNYLLDGIFDSVEGHGTGIGYITGDLEYIDFDSEFEIHRATVVPVFFHSRLDLNGRVSVGRQNGVRVHNLNVRDRGNGSGTVSGNYDFNEFQAERFMDFTLRMNNLRFLDNNDGPDIPFYGRVAGTGVVNISGSNISPFVRTIEPVQTTSQSRLSIPLMQQLDGADHGRFIRFVKDFKDVDSRRQLTSDPEVLRQVDRTFMETFRLDLQFVAADNSTVQLIFDPVTGEIVNARGGGRVHVTLEDETLQIFGNYNITDGDYLFVGGDILTRRFTLREGGSIRWDGDPANAILDINAVYRARPNIAPLLGAAADQTNRVAVELQLVITGPIDNIENDFYFEFPNAIDATQNAAVLNILNSEEQKLIQATSLLFTGGFISGALVGDTQTQELGSTLQARAGQVGISQLLSSQINALLSDNLINLDVDLNLFGFDQADLGIALRLFDDRLILRREGEVGGEEAYIGDLGATYRINPNLSVEVFHRKDPMLLSILGDQAGVENVNGVGLEAQFRFNTWREFGNRVWRNITGLFGLRSRGEEESDETEDEFASIGE
jgi:translocation and assembly module TamB